MAKGESKGGTNGVTEGTKPQDQIVDRGGDWWVSEWKEVEEEEERKKRW